MGAVLWTQLPWSPRVIQQWWLCPESCLCVQHSPACPGFLTELQTCCFRTEGLKDHFLLHSESPPSVGPKQRHSHHSSASIHSFLSWGTSAGLWALAGGRGHLCLPQPSSPQIMGKAHPHWPLPEGNQLLRKDSLFRVEITWNQSSLWAEGLLFLIVTLFLLHCFLLVSKWPYLLLRISYPHT